MTAALPEGWFGCTGNAIFFFITLVLFIINLGNFLNLLPEVLSCILRSRPNIGLEHNLRSSSKRDATVLCMLPAFTMIACRFKLYAPSFVGLVPEDWTLTVVLLTFIAITASRYIFYPLRPRELHGDESKAAHNALYTCFIGMMCLMIPTVCILLAAHVPDNAARVILLCETAVFFLLSIIRTCFFLLRHSSVFSTILYLCALELIPAVLAIVSNRLF